MITVSNEYLEAVKGIGREWKNTVTISDGVHTETYDSASIEITESFASDENTLSMGSAFSNSCKITLYQPLRTIAYRGKEVKVQSGLLVGEDYEYVDMGTFYVSEMSTTDDYQTLELTCYDVMAKMLNEKYEPNVSTPTTDSDILADICEQYNVEFASTPMDREIKEIYGDTVGELLGYLAGIQGKNAIINRRGEIEFRWYDGGKGETHKALSEYTHEELSHFTHYELVLSDEVITSTEQKESGYEQRNETLLQIDSITSGTEQNPIVVGTGKGINFTNPYITESDLEEIGKVVLGVRYMPCTVDTFGNPTYEVGDIVMCDDKAGHSSPILLSSITYTLSGGCSAKIVSSGGGDTDIAFSSIPSPTERKLKQAYTTLQQAIAEASALINGAKGGIFEVTDSDGDGVNDGWILANDKDKSKQTKFIRANYEGIGLSTDGGKTYTQAITHEGINCSVLNGGVINGQVINGGTINGTTVNSTSGNIGGFTINNNGLTNGVLKIDKNGSSTLYTVADIYIIQMFLLGILDKPPKPSKLFDHYDVNKDGTISIGDLTTLRDNFLNLG